MFGKRIRRATRARRGSALMLTLVFTLGMSGLAISAIYLAGGTQIVSKLYDRERDYRLLLAGYLTLRLTNEDVLGDLALALEKLRNVVDLRRDHRNGSYDVQT